MGKATIIEAQNSNTVYEEGKTSGILGKLKGIFADYKNGTRNADRLYTEELWDNRVFGSEDVMEALETKTLFGELDHPEGDRCETLAKNAAISITKLEKRPEEGVIYGEAEILDTPTGRIVKALADSGAKLGISSRGMGEEIYEEGRNIIDPNTYDFITFDVVVTPANTKARVSLTESKHMSILTESLKKEIEESETENQLNQIKTVLKNINTESKEDLVRTIETKINNITNKKNVKLNEANKEVAIKLLKRKLLENSRVLSEVNKANTQLIAENKNLVEKNGFLSESRDMLKNEIKTKTESIKNDNFIGEEKVKELKNKIKFLEESKDSAINEALLKQRKINDRKLENIQLQHKEEITKLEESKKSLQSKLEESKLKVNKVLEENKKLISSVNNEKKLVLENKSNTVKLENTIKELTKKVETLEAEKVNANKKLEESKKVESDRVKTLTKQVESLKKQLEESRTEILESQDRFSKLAFDPIGNVKVIAENFQNGNGYTQEDLDLINAISGKN